MLKNVVLAECYLTYIDNLTENGGTHYEAGAF
jgi:hypothetical protein